MKRVFRVILFTLISLLLVACSGNKEVSDINEKTIKIGTAGNSSDAVTAVLPSLEEKGYKVDMVTFDDMVSPNTALVEGSIDMNIYQHTPYLEEYNKSQGTKLKMVNPLIYYGKLGIYSEKYGKINDIPSGGKIAIYNDPSNEDRALKLLSKAGLIKLKDKSEGLYSEFDIEENPKKLEFIKLQLQQMVANIGEVDAATVVSIAVLKSGKDPSKAIFFEEPNENLAVGIAVRDGDEDSEKVKAVLDAYRDKKTHDRFNEIFKGANDLIIE